jgi:hypothetical protein
MSDRRWHVIAGTNGPGQIIRRHQLGRDLDAEQVRLVGAFLGALTGELPEFARMPDLEVPRAPRPDGPARAARSTRRRRARGELPYCWTLARRLKAEQGLARDAGLRRTIRVNRAGASS